MVKKYIIKKNKDVCTVKSELISIKVKDLNSALKIKEILENNNLRIAYLLINNILKSKTEVL